MFKQYPAIAYTPRCVDATQDLLWNFYERTGDLLRKLDPTSQPEDVRELLDELKEIEDDAGSIIGIAQGITREPEFVKAFEDKMKELGYPDEANHQKPSH